MTSETLGVIYDLRDSRGVCYDLRDTRGYVVFDLRDLRV